MHKEKTPDIKSVIKAIERARKQSEEYAQDHVIIPFKELNMILKLLKDNDEVVRCRDCEFFIGDGYYCKIRGLGRALKNNDFCSDGKLVKWNG